VLDGATDAVIAILDFSKTPMSGGFWSFVISGDGSKLYALAQTWQGMMLGIITSATGAVTGTVHLKNSEHFAKMLLIGPWLYLMSGRRLLIVDPQKQSVISDEVMCYGQDSLLYFAMHPDGHHIDMCGQLVDTTIQGKPYFTGNYGKVYTSGGKGYEVGKSVHAGRWDGKPSSPPDDIPVPAAELGMSVDQAAVFAPDWMHGVVNVISTATNRVTDTIAVGPHPHGVGIQPTGLNR
jgi:YVTN family beta-propeller protein